MQRKRFNKGWHNSNDPKSRVIVIQYMKSCGFGFHSNNDKYGIDLISDFKNPMVGLELERRSIWDEVEYPYNSIHIPARKLKFLGSDNVHYIVINKDFDRVGICLGKVLKHYLEACIEVPNEAVKAGEYFIHVPKGEFHWIRIHV